MGYRTRYALTVHPPYDDTAIRAALVQASYGHSSPFESDGAWIDGECKWYSHAVDCQKVADALDVKFTVSGVGEDEGDVWSIDYEPLIVPS